MFDIDFRPQFTRPVSVVIPSGASNVEQQFSATFEALDIPEFNGFDLADPEGCKRFLERTLVGADDVVDKNGDPVAYSKAVRDRLIAISWTRQGLLEAYLKGFQKAAQGN